jgi:hypothetical protein
VNLRTFAFGDGLTYATNDVRLAISALGGALGGPGNPLGVASGVRPGIGGPMLVSTAGGLSVSVNTGYAIIQGSAALNAGVYEAILDTAATLTCTAADTVNPRVDLVCVTINDLGSSASTSVVQIVTGTPAPSPSAPATPSNSIPLAWVTVPANATALSSGNISDQRTYYVGAGGIKPVTNSSFYPTSGNGSMYLHDLSTHRLKWYNGTSVQAPNTVGFAPSYGPSGTVTATGTAQTVSSTNVTVDGSTDVRVTLKWSYISTAGSGSGTGFVLAAKRGSTQIDSIIKYCTAADSFIDGGSVIFYDPAPAAGTYTYAFTVVNQGAGTAQVHAGIVTAEAVPS